MRKVLESHEPIRQGNVKGYDADESRKWVLRTVWFWNTLNAELAKVDMSTARTIQPIGEQGAEDAAIFMQAAARTCSLFKDESGLDARISTPPDGGFEMDDTGCARFAMIEIEGEPNAHLEMAFVLTRRFSLDLVIVVVPHKMKPPEESGDRLPQ